MKKQIFKGHYLTERPAAPARSDQPTFAGIAAYTCDSVATIWRIANDAGRADPMPCFARYTEKPGKFFAPYDLLNLWMERRKKWKMDQKERIKKQKIETEARKLRARSRSAEYWSAKRGRRLTARDVQVIENERNERHGPAGMTREFKLAVAAMNHTAPTLVGKSRPRTPDQWEPALCWIWAQDLKPMAELYSQILPRAKKGALLMGDPL